MKKPWSDLLGRLTNGDAPDELVEWATPVYDVDGIAAWAAYADELGVRASSDDDGVFVVAWDFPIIPRMKKALARLEKKKPKSALEKRLLRRLIEDLRSYRDTGYSSRSAAKSA